MRNISFSFIQPVKLWFTLYFFWYTIILFLLLFTLNGISLAQNKSAIVTTEFVTGKASINTAILKTTLTTVTTGQATNITSNSAMLNGTLGLSSSVDVKYWFEYGTVSGSYSEKVDVGSRYGPGGEIKVSWTVSGLSAETTYYYRFLAEDYAGITYGSEVSFTTTFVPLPVVTTGAVTNITTNSVKLNGIVNTSGWTTTVWFEYGTSHNSYTNTSSTQSVSETTDTTVSIEISGLSAGTTYYYRLVAQNSAGTAYGSEMSFTTTDTASPNGSISINAEGYYTNTTTVTLTLSATDDVGVSGYYISTSSTTPSASDSGWTAITSTTSYTEDISYTLSSGDGSKTIYVWYKDASENISRLASTSIILDTATPTIIITSPTSSATYTSTSNVVSLDGVAFDSTSGISGVTWVNSNGESGTATGTTSWSISNVSLSSGDNVITVTALDGAENTNTDIITVTYSQPTPIPSPSPTPNEKGSISGYVIDRRGNPIESAKIRLKVTNTKVLKKTTSDEDGVFEFADLDADTYTITALKKGYKTVKQTITLEEGEYTDIEIEMKKTSKRIAVTIEH
ncbi:MAG: carboxypeptidase regulatory-like domain-containing protein [Planctomycetes bacterium]|nr:carboxypeptidase regulatory-like domain-containing protein [Planctomycetota bacterium]